VLSPDIRAVHALIDPQQRVRFLSLSAAGKCPNDLGFAADADDLPPVRQQHGMPGGLAQLL